MGALCSSHDLVAKVAVLEHRLEALEARVAPSTPAAAGLAASARTAVASPAPRPLAAPAQQPSVSFAAAPLPAAADAPAAASDAAAAAPPKKKKKKVALVAGEAAAAAAAVAAAAPAPAATAVVAPSPLSSGGSGGLAAKLKGARASAAAPAAPDLDAALAPVATALSAAAAKRMPKELVEVDPAHFSSAVALPLGLGQLLGDKTDAVVALARGVGTVVKEQQRIVAGCQALQLATKAVRLKDGALQLTLSRPPDSAGAPPFWLAPVKCNGGHTGIYRNIVLDFTGSTLACVVKLCLAPAGLGAEEVTTEALRPLRAHCVARLALEAGSSVTLPVPFGRYYVKYLAGPPGCSAGALLARCSGAGGVGELLGAGGGFVDYVREFDASTGASGSAVSLCSLEGDVFPPSVSLRCGGSGGACILESQGAASYTTLSVSVTGKKGAGSGYAF